MNNAAQAQADLMLKQMKTSPAIVSALFDHALTFLAKKHALMNKARERAMRKKNLPRNNFNE